MSRRNYHAITTMIFLAVEISIELNANSHAMQSWTAATTAPENVDSVKGVACMYVASQHVDVPWHVDMCVIFHALQPVLLAWQIATTTVAIASAILFVMNLVYLVENDASGNASIIDALVFAVKCVTVHHVISHVGRF